MAAPELGRSPAGGVSSVAEERTLAELRIELLGGCRVTVGARVVPEEAWRRRKAAAVLKLLALAPAHRFQREQLMEALWPDLEPHAAGANLRRESPKPYIRIVRQPELQEA